MKSLGNIKIKLHSLLFLEISKTQAFVFLCHGRQRPLYPTLSTPWRYMTWRHKEPGHQQPWHSPHSLEFSDLNSRRVFRLSDDTIKTWSVETQLPIYFICEVLSLSLINLTSEALIINNSLSTYLIKSLFILSQMHSQFGIHLLGDA